MDCGDPLHPPETLCNLMVEDVSGRPGAKEQSLHPMETLMTLEHSHLGTLLPHHVQVVGQAVLVVVWDTSPLWQEGFEIFLKFKLFLGQF